MSGKGRGRGRGRGKVVETSGNPNQHLQAQQVKGQSLKSQNFNGVNDGPIGQSVYKQAPNGHQAYGAVPNGHQAYGAVPNGHQAYGAVLNGQQAYGAVPNGQQAYGAVPNGQQAYGAVPNGQQAYGAVTNGHLAYGQPTNGQIPYRHSPNGQPDYGIVNTPNGNQNTSNGQHQVNGQSLRGKPVNGQATKQSYSNGSNGSSETSFPSLQEARENFQQSKPPEKNQFSDAVAPVNTRALTEVPHKVQPSKEVAKVSPQDIHVNGNRAKRPGYGTLGYKKIDLLVNYFKLNIPHGLVHQYDVDIERIEVDKKFKRPNRYDTTKTRKIFEKIVKEYDIFNSHLPVYDGNKVVITRRSLGIDRPQEFRVAIIDEEREEVYNVTIKPSVMRKKGSQGRDGEIDLDEFHRFIETKKGELPKEAIKALDLVFKHGPSLSYTPIGKSFFRKPHVDDVPPGCEGREIWFGYCESVRPCEWSPIINIDLTATTFYEAGTCLSFLEKVCGLRSLDQKLRDNDLRKFSDEIKSLKVKVTHNIAYQRKFRVVGATKRDAREMTFPLSQEGKPDIEVSVEYYFKTRYKIKLHYPHLPLLQMQPREKNIFIPIECCEILPDQHCRKKLSETMTAKMIKETCRTPKQRFREIKQNVEDAKRKALPYLKEFGIEMSTDPMVAQGRVLNPPQIVYKSQDSFMPREGQWTMQNHEFFQGAVIEEWAIINFGFCNEQARMNLEKMLTTIGKECGIQFGKCQYNEDLKETRMTILEILKRMKVKFPKITLVIVILNANKSLKTPATYEEIKQVSDTQLGLVTQCVKDINASKKCSNQLISNICQKINAKMGGINNTILGPKSAPNERPKLMDTPVIIMGADVTHPAPDKDDPSIAAVVGSMDRHLTRYAARIKVQKNLQGYQARVELILELKDMVKSLLMCFYRKINKKPGRIIFYRDGVSEGQFSDVCSYEINAIKHACQELEASYKPSITFIVVQKRHSTRFCPKNDRDGMGRPGNVPPGTTVDRGITSPVDFDFYLCSHFGLQGTSKPTHYTTLWDESNLSADEIQTLSYYLCHTYSRCTRSISLPAPVQYAHLAAFRARAHIKKVLEGSSNGSSSGKQKYGSMVAVDNIADAVTIEEKLADSMYFI